MLKMADIVHMRESRRDREGGFSLAETLAVVAILIILMGVGFIALMRWRTVLRQLEFDATAKEIYMAAQNHLSLAESQGLLETMNGERPAFSRGEEDTNYKTHVPSGSDDSAEKLDDVYYFIYNSSVLETDENNPNNKASVLNLMLPVGSIDDTVRTGGSYIICYQHSTATILEVFYTADGKLSSSEYSTLMDDLRGDENKTARQSVNVGGKSIIVGYYGGDGSEAAFRLKAPTVQVKNGDTLSVIVTYPEVNQSRVDEYNEKKTDGEKATLDLKLIIEAEVEGSTISHAYDLNEITGTTDKEGNTVFTIVLDDVTKLNGSFNKQMTEFTPGCNLSILAWVSGKNVRATVAKSAPVTTNSLFASSEMGTGANSTTQIVKIASYRHLANLSLDVSGFNPSGAVDAIQTTDLSWSEFKESIKDIRTSEKAADTDTYVYYNGNHKTAANTFLPVFASYQLTYEGNGHRLAGVAVSVNGPAGVFAELRGSGSKISNLEVVNASITSNGTLDVESSDITKDSVAGGLIGQLNSGTSVENVLVRTTLKASKDTTKAVAGKVSAGGLIGAMAGGTVTNCAAVVYVSSDGNAGGLVGSADGGTIQYSYSSGHTTAGVYDKNGTYDVTSSGKDAGGLVGTSAATIKCCYTTCSVSGVTAGGFAGSITDGSVSKTYATGLVKGTGDTGAYVGNSSKPLNNANYFYQVMNNVTNEDETTTAMPAVGTGISDSSQLPQPFDVMDSTETNRFATFETVYSGGSADSALAVPYDSDLAKLYVVYEDGKGKTHYAFKSIKEWADSTWSLPEESTLGNDKIKPFTAHLTRHYGDWPAPETLVVNTQ